MQQKRSPTFSGLFALVKINVCANWLMWNICNRKEKVLDGTVVVEEIIGVSARKVAKITSLNGQDKLYWLSNTTVSMIIL